MAGIKGRSGGRRKGAGRKRGRTRVVRMFSLSLAANEIVNTVPSGKRSKFVDAAIISACGCSLAEKVWSRRPLTKGNSIVCPEFSNRNELFARSYL